MGVYNERLPDDQQVRTYRAVHDNELLHFWSSRDEENKPQRHRPRTRDPTEVRLSNRSACVNKPSLVDATACECCKKSDISSDKATDRHSYENLLLSHERCDRQRTKDDPVVPASPPSVTHEQTSNCCYYDAHLASKCHKLLNQCSGKCASTRVMLFPEEEWAKSAPGIQWSLKMNRWWKRYCTVTEFRAGGRRVTSAVGRLTQNEDGTVTIAGRFKRNKDPDFRLHLTARVTQDDFERGYALTGALQLGDLKGEGRLEITHFAVVPKHQAELEKV